MSKKSEQVDLTELEALIAGVLQYCPGAKTDLEDPVEDGDPYHLIFTYRGNEIAVDWLSSLGFQVYPEGEKPEAGEHIDTCVLVEECVRNVVSLLNG